MPGGRTADRRTGWPRGTAIAVSGAITPQSVGRDRIAGADRGARRIGALEALRAALAAFTTAQYGRDGKLDDSALDEALDAGSQVLERARLEQTWVDEAARGAPRAAARLDNARVVPLTPGPDGVCATW